MVVRCKKSALAFNQDGEIVIAFMIVESEMNNHITIARSQTCTGFRWLYGKHPEEKSVRLKHRDEYASRSGEI